MKPRSQRPRRETPAPSRARRARERGGVRPRARVFVSRRAPAGVGERTRARAAAGSGSLGPGHDPSRRIRLHRVVEGQAAHAHPGRSHDRLRSRGGPPSEPLCRREGPADRLSGRRSPRDGPLRTREVRRAHAGIPAFGQCPMDRQGRRARRNRGDRLPPEDTHARSALEGAFHAGADVADRSFREVRHRRARHALRGARRGLGDGRRQRGTVQDDGPPGPLPPRLRLGGARVRHGRVALGGPRRGRPSPASDGVRGRPPLMGAPHRQCPGRPGRRRASSRSGGLGRHRRRRRIRPRRRRASGSTRATSAR